MDVPHDQGGLGAREAAAAVAGLRTFLYAIPIVNFVMWFFAWQDIEEYCKRARTQDFPMIVFWILTLFFGIVGLYTYPVVQMRLDDAHRAATNGRATNAPMQTADWIAIAVGWVFAILWILIIIVPRSAAAEFNAQAEL